MQGAGQIRVGDMEKVSSLFFFFFLSCWGSSTPANELLPEEGELNPLSPWMAGKWIFNCMWPVRCWQGFLQQRGLQGHIYVGSLWER